MKIDMHVHALPAKLTEEIFYREAYRVKKVVDTAAAKGLDAIIFTDFGHMGGFRVLHDNVKINDKRLFDDSYEIKKEESALKIGCKNYKKTLRVFLGEEIATKQGEVLGCFIRDYIEPNQDIDETLKEIDRQGGVGIFPHPLATFPGAGGIGEVEIRRQLSKNNCIKAVEVFNGQLVFPTSYLDKKAKKIADDFLAVGVGGSDARGYMFKQYERVGSVYTDFLFLKEMSKEDIRDYIKKKSLVEITGTHNNLAVVAAMMLPVAFNIVKEKIVG